MSAKTLGQMFLEGAPTRKLNRIASRRPRGGFFWCDTCDRDAVAPGCKCSVCGTRSVPAKKMMHRFETR